MATRVLTAVGRGLAPAAAVALVACGGGSSGPRDDLAVDTARFSYGGRSVEVPLVDCGREGDVVILAGARGSVVLQAAADLGDGGAARSGVTADLGGEDGILGAFGTEHDRGPAGEITAVRTDGDRLVIAGRWTRFDEELRPEAMPSNQLVDGRLVARCPETDAPSD